MRIHYSLGHLKPKNTAESADAAPALKAKGWNFAQRTSYVFASAQRLRAADAADLQQLTGTSMGTHWQVRVRNPAFVPLEHIRSAIEAELEQVVRHMSHWEGDSALSRFNHASADSWHALPDDLSHVLHAGLHWAQRSGGAFDPTLGQLVAAWGFGPHAPSDPTHWRPASPASIQQAQASSGWQRLQHCPKRGWHQSGGLHLDLSGIAKGYAVDAVLQRLHALGLPHCLVEIGGELRASGQRSAGQPWRVAIAPVPQAAGALPNTAPNAPPEALALRDWAIATSGDLYHTHHWQGRSYSHTLDARSGQPIAHDLASVSVLHPECMHADALATLLTVLGPEAGLAFAEQHDIAARLASASATHYSSAWHRYLRDTQTAGASATATAANSPSSRPHG